jgi:hypothetical protein
MEGVGRKLASGSAGALRSFPTPCRRGAVEAHPGQFSERHSSWRRRRDGPPGAQRIQGCSAECRLCMADVSGDSGPLIERIGAVDAAAVIATTVWGSHPCEPETARFQRVRAKFSRGAGIPANSGRLQWIRSANLQSPVDRTINAADTCSMPYQRQGTSCGSPPRPPRSLRRPVRDLQGEPSS